MPETPQDLADHACINLRLSTHGALYAWEFQAADGHETRVKVRGQTCFNTINPVMRAAADGHGLARIPERLAAEHLVSGALKTCLDAFCPSFPGFHLYYPSRQRPSSAYEVVLEALRERA